MNAYSFNPAFAKVEISSGMVAENNRVYLYLLTFCKITFIASWKPISNNMSASSKIKNQQAVSIMFQSLKCWVRRPGVAIRMSGLAAKDSNCPSMLSPPTTRANFRSVYLVKNLSWVAVYSASSLLGETIKALIPTTLECSFRLLMSGIRKAAVFPLPVLLQATTSLPSMISGITFLQIGVGTLQPFALIALQTGYIRLRLSKPPDFYLFMDY